MKKRTLISLCVTCTALLLFAVWLAHFYRHYSGEGLYINELLASSDSILLSESSANAEWIELYNSTSAPVNLEGYGLSKDPDEPYLWTFPDVVIQSKGYLLVFMDFAGEQDLHSEEPDADILYTDFRLSSRGGIVTLTDPEGVLVDSFEYQECITNVPYGRTPDGGRPALLNTATPGYANRSRVSRYSVLPASEERPSFSHPSGFYEAPFYLEIAVPEGASVYYTLDGSEPDWNSYRYEGPVFLEDPSSLPNRYADINTSYSNSLLSSYGKETVEKAVVVRARVCRDGQFSKYTEDATYFIGKEHQLTTVSLIVDPEDFFGYDDGIYVGGKLLEYFRRTAYNPFYSERRQLGNFSVTGEDGSRQVHIEIFDKGETAPSVDQTGDVRISGGLHSSAEADKSLRLYATSRYGDSNRFDIPFFGYSETDNSQFRQLVLRTNPYFIQNGFQDVFGTLCFLGEGLCVQAYEPVSLYINGEYWGVAALRERIDENMVADHYGVDPDSLVLLKYSTMPEQVEDVNDPEGQMVIKKGTQEDLEDYIQLFEYASEHDLSIPENYQYLEERIDMDNYIRWQLAHIFFACVDWPDNNVRVFRTTSVDPDHPYADGKWRFLLFDLDDSVKKVEHNTLLYAMGKGSRGWEDNNEPSEWSTALFAGLMENASFREQFLAVYQEYRNGIFQPDNLNAFMDRLLEEWGGELEKHNERWRQTPSWLGSLLYKDMDSQTWLAEDQEGQLAQMRDFCDSRLSNMDRFMEDFYAGKGEVIVWE